MKKIHETSLGQKSEGERVSDLLVKVDANFKAIEAEMKKKMSEFDFDKESRKNKRELDGKFIEVKE